MMVLEGDGGWWMLVVGFVFWLVIWMLWKMERGSESCLLGRYDGGFCRRSGKAGEGESVLSKATRGGRSL